MHFFYCENMEEGVLDAEESRHAVRVLRLKEGDEIEITNGFGMKALARIVVADEHACTFQIAALSLADLPPADIGLAVAPTKNPSRMEWLVEKAVEMGVTQIALLQGDHSERTFMKTDRLQRIAISAMKQSLRCLLPQIHPVISVREFITEIYHAEDQQLLIAHCYTAMPRLPLREAMQPGRHTTVMIGPEGDFSVDEVELATKFGFQPISLGGYRLRTETAALHVASAFNFLNTES